MKHLRSYTLFDGVSLETKIFEDIDEEFSDITSKVNDILSYLTDEGFSTKVYMHSKTEPLSFAVEINRMDNPLKHNEFNINDIKDEVIEFVNQMSDEYKFLYFYKAYYQCKEYWYKNKVGNIIATSGDINDISKSDELLIDFVKLEFKKK